ncbi:hypothetical protein PUR34_39590 [Streptomyces sp. JV185]|uniref:hypothetical protein n=1 Tax=Streptomyces sp. JV185 TaxID=858638 RepID=UPI002E7A783F|nr:hypothetical protein [Streptomyces sp. JV185]MEE1774114.1 hypothetical protein [Streptomyces sp. JV185]
MARPLQPDAGSVIGPRAHDDYGNYGNYGTYDTFVTEAAEYRQFLFHALIRRTGNRHGARCP